MANLQGNSFPIFLNIDPNNLSNIIHNVEGDRIYGIADLFFRLIPSNIISSAAKGNVLGMVFFGLLFGYFIIRLPSDQQKVMSHFWQAILDIMLNITRWVMKFAPYGVFALVAKTMATTGFQSLVPLLMFFFTVLGCLLFHVFISLMMLLRWVGKIKNPFQHFKAMFSVLLTAFSTASSAATLPLTLDEVEKKAGGIEKSV